jgi:curved DNA-binding protein CbpA
MRNCVCGAAIEDESTLCGRCSALRELGLGAGSTLGEVKAAYKTLVKVWHPDRFQGDPKLKQEAEKKLKAINAALTYLDAEGKTDGEGRKTGAGQSRPDGASAEGSTADEPPAQEPVQGPISERATRVPPAKASSFGQKLAIRLLVLAAVLGIGAFFFNIADSAVAADPTTGRYYVEFKSRMKNDFAEARAQTWGELEQRYHSIFGGGLETAPVAAPLVSEPAAALPETDTTASSEKRVSARTPAKPMQLLPLITVGLTRDEVISARGEPTSSTNDKLMYGRSELDLKDGRVVGWKVDPRSPVRVKLWPDGPVDTSLRFFTVGSTKDEVLAVQGTPTSFAQDRFDYGSSTVYFRDNLVMVWKDGSVRLRAQR